MLAKVTHISGLANVRRTRILPVNGRVLVSPGQRVHASDVLAETNNATRHVLLDVRRWLGYARVDEAQRTIIRQEGEKVQKGDIIAETGGLFSRIVRAPDDGQVVTISAGRVLLEVESQPVQILAGISGVVTDLIPERGATVEGNGALIQGVWGNGPFVGEGLMVILLKTPRRTAAHRSGGEPARSHRGRGALPGPRSAAQRRRAATARLAADQHVFGPDLAGKRAGYPDHGAGRLRTNTDEPGRLHPADHQR
ncbi:MAG TPA: hypothetical protein PJ988_17765, partial [Anaerolinea sp.]|nr:hypothetical protein [Anaerolinea sp.]